LKPLSKKKYHTCQENIQENGRGLLSLRRTASHQNENINKLSQRFIFVRIFCDLQQ